LSADDFESWRAAYLCAGPKRNEWDRNRRTADRLKKSDYRVLLRSLKAHQSSEQKIDLGIFRQDTDEYIGSVAIICVNRSFMQSAIIGYFLFPTHWRKGFGKEAIAAAMDIAFKDLKLHRLHAPISPNNVRSKKLARSLKFRNEGLCKRYLLIDGKWTDHCIFAITSEEYVPEKQ
jgi:[ribosomal protein S5]-alanine N-acetyltransferase